MKTEGIKRRNGREARKSVIIYDRSCPFCAATVKWVRRNDRTGAFDAVPCQSGAIGTRYRRIERAACMKALHLVREDGSVLVGEKAFPEIFRRLERYRVAALLLKVPGAGLASRVVYRWFADHRYAIARVLFHQRGARGRHH